jgi:hypothetical protein
VEYNASSCGKEKKVIIIVFIKEITLNRCKEFTIKKI